MTAVSAFSATRREVLTATLLGVHGRLQREGGVIHLIADRLVDLGGVLKGLTTLNGDEQLNAPWPGPTKCNARTPAPCDTSTGKG